MTNIRLILLLSLLCPAMPAFGQDKPETNTNAAGTVADEDADDEAGAEDETADSGETEDVSADEAGDADEDPDAMEEDLDDEADDDEAFAADSSDDEDPIALSPPKTVELDMTALGQIDPEADLAEGGTLDQQAAKSKAELWTERALDILDLSGYYRLRPELYHKFNIRNDDAAFNQTMEQQDPNHKNDTSTGANMRFRLSPTLHISEAVRIKAQMDFLDNVMLGATPRYFQGQSDTVQLGRMQGWDMGAPSSDDMIVVRRVWGEVNTPLGQLRFGRMGDHFGTGMLHNDGNQLLDDFGNTVDRIMFAAKINDWLIAPAFDFPSEGIVGTNAAGRPFDLSQLDDAYRLVGIFAYMHDKEVQDAMLRRGDWVVNAGLYFSYRWQVLSFENNVQASGTYNSEYDSYSDEELEDEEAGTYQFYNREYWAITPNLWFQLLYGSFHLELEAALIFGELGNSDRTSDGDDAEPLTLIQWGGVLQMDYGLLADALRIGAEFGYAHGDADVKGVRAPVSFDQENNRSDDTFSAFSFNPAYSMDMILHRHILGSVAQSFYLKGWLKYDFLNQEGGDKLGIRADVIYSRAIFADSTLSGSSANLGVELNAQIRYQSAEGFFAGLAYGVLFPLAAFKGDPDGDEGRYGTDNDLAIPQTLQTVLGITF